MIVTGENRSTRKETCATATLSTTSQINWPGIKTRSLRCEWPGANHLSQSAALPFRNSSK